MRNILCFTLVQIMVMVLAACTASTVMESAPPSPAEIPAVVFADPVLEAKVRAAMGKPEGDITAAEAEAVTELNLGIEWQQDISEGTQIKELSGLDYFKNLESLNLSGHAVTDISPLAGLTKLTSLSLGGNPVADISPLSGMTSLRRLTLSGCAAQDYSPLSGIVDLEILTLDDSAITDISALSGISGMTTLSLAHTQVSDISPLAALTNLKQLYLEDCPVADYLPLADIYPNLEEKDFTAAFTLAELGFSKEIGSAQAKYDVDDVDVEVSHSEWGIQPIDSKTEENSVHMFVQMDNGYTLVAGYYPDKDTYVFGMCTISKVLMNYTYDPANSNFVFNIGTQESAEQDIEAALGDLDADDILLAPISVFNDTIIETFSITADALYALPFENPTLLNLGCVADEANAFYEYVEKDETEEVETYYSVCVHRPEWGEQDFDVRFFTSVNGYGLVITYDTNAQRFHVSADNPENGTYAVFDFNRKDNSKTDGEVSEGTTVEAYFKSVYDDPAITDIYLYSVTLMEQYITDTFGMSIDELYALPVGE